MSNQLFNVNGKWLNRERMEKARGLKKESKTVSSIPDTVDDELEQLKAECKEKGITFHHASGVRKLKELLEKE